MVIEKQMGLPVNKFVFSFVYAFYNFFNGEMFASCAECPRSSSVFDNVLKILVNSDLDPVQQFFIQLPIFHPGVHGSIHVVHRDEVIILFAGAIPSHFLQTSTTAAQSSGETSVDDWSDCCCVSVIQWEQLVIIHVCGCIRGWVEEDQFILPFHETWMSIQNFSQNVHHHDFLCLASSCHPSTFFVYGEKSKFTSGFVELDPL
mmetsp:Transcript_655/g.1516  ORF Transcript_655/g.1516 Transcript_655/m.1516 type:complete len:203 (-) Transcript_655:2052-2660(-)